MAKAKKQEKQIEPIEETIIQSSLDQIVSDRFGRYAKYIIQERALPDVRDGLKPVQRRIIYAMTELGLTHNKPFKKSARVVGEVIGKYHPHGDSSIYDALVRMAQDWKMNIPLIEVHGNKGSIDDDPAAAMRYTEARLSEISEHLVYGIKKDTVKFSPNFDDSEEEPVVLPALIPNLLVNGAMGIAAGYATEMPPHNLGEIIDAIIMKLRLPTTSVDELLTVVKGPDFPTGGIIQGEDGIISAFKTGRGRIAIKSRYRNTSDRIEIYEIPYGVIKSKLVKQIDDIIYERKIAGLKEVRDESDRNGITIAIDIDKNVDVEKVMDYLYSKTELQVYYNYNNVAIKDRAPRVMGIIDLIDAYIKHQKEVQVKSIKFDLNKDVVRHEIIEGLIKASGIVDQIIEAIKNVAGSKSEVVKTLIALFDFTEIQADAIAELKLYRLSRTDQETYLKEKEELSKRIKWANKILDSNSELNKHIISLLEKVKEKFATPRKTDIEAAMFVKKIDIEQLIRHEDFTIAITRDGYIKRFTEKMVVANDMTKLELKEKDSLVYFKKINTADKILLFTNKGRYVILHGHKVVETKWKEIGKHVNDYAEIERGEVIVDVVVVENYNISAFVVLITKLGKGKRVRIEDFEMQKTSKASTAILLQEDDELIGARVSNGLMNVIIISSKGNALNYPETQLSVYGTKSGGVRSNGFIMDEVATAFVVADRNDVIGLISSRGGMKRIKVSTIAPAGKNSVGKSLYRMLKGNPHVTIDAKVVEPTTKVYWSFEDKPIESTDFKNIGITHIEEGFSLSSSNYSIYYGNIFEYERIDSNYNPVGSIPTNVQEEVINDQHKKTTTTEITKPVAKKTLSADELFKEAEDSLNALDQISLDDLLKGIK